MRSKQPCAPQRHCGPSGRMVRWPDLTGVRIGAAPDVALRPDAAADAGRKRHVEERIEALAGAVDGLADGADVGVVIHHHRHAEQIAQVRCKREILPAAHVRGERHSLGGEVDRTAETHCRSARSPVRRARRARLIRSGPASTRARPAYPWSAIRGAACGRPRRPPQKIWCRRCRSPALSCVLRYRPEPGAAYIGHWPPAPPKCQTRARYP